MLKGNIKGFEIGYKEIIEKMRSQQLLNATNTEFQKSLSTCHYHRQVLIPKINDEYCSFFESQPPPYMGINDLTKLIEAILPELAKTEKSNLSPKSKIRNNCTNSVEKRVDGLMESDIPVQPKPPQENPYIMPPMQPPYQFQGYAIPPQYPIIPLHKNI